MRYWLGTLNNGLPDNPKLRIREQGENRIHLTPLDKQAEPPSVLNDIGSGTTQHGDSCECRGP